MLWIPDGWENARHLTVFNNGGGRPDGDWSSVAEIAPPIDAEGNSVLEERRAFGPEAPVWTYQAEDLGQQSQKGIYWRCTRQVGVNLI